MGGASRFASSLPAHPQPPCQRSGGGRGRLKAAPAAGARERQARAGGAHGGSGRAGSIARSARPCSLPPPPHPRSPRCRLVRPAAAPPTPSRQAYPLSRPPLPKTKRVVDGRERGSSCFSRLLQSFSSGCLGACVVRGVRHGHRRLFSASESAPSYRHQSTVTSLGGPASGHGTKPKCSGSGSGVWLHHPRCRS
eukprot:scaffold45119_cov31-Tisochrysis_lutea.AAC.2